MLLTINNAKKSFGSVNVLKDLSLEIESGKLYGLLGPNGCGKTTLMKAIDGLITLDSGEIYFKGQDVGAETKAKIVFMPTEAYFYKYMSLSDAKRYYMDFFEDFQPNEFDLLIEEFELDEKQKITKMSSGQIGKLKLALALSRDAELYLLDEPLNGIDLVARDLVIDKIIERMSSDKAMLVSSHLVEELESVADSIIMMKKGDIAVFGDSDSLRQNENMSIADLYRKTYAQRRKND